MRSFLILLATVFSGSAFATGGFQCATQDVVDGLNFEIQGVTSRSFANAVVDAYGTAAGLVGEQKKAVDFAFQRSDVRQYWNDGAEFRLVLYAEKEVNNTLESITAVIKTTSTDQIIFNGTAEISGADWQMDAPIVCAVE